MKEVWWKKNDEISIVKEKLPKKDDEKCVEEKDYKKRMTKKRWWKILVKKEW